MFPKITHTHVLWNDPIPKSDATGFVRHCIRKANETQPDYPNNTARLPYEHSPITLGCYLIKSACLANSNCQPKAYAELNTRRGKESAFALMRSTLDGL